MKLNQALIATGFPFRTKHYIDDYLMAFKSIFMRVSGIRRAGAAALDWHTWLRDGWTAFGKSA